MRQVDIEIKGTHQGLILYLISGREEISVTLFLSDYERDWLKTFLLKMYGLPMCSSTLTRSNEEAEKLFKKIAKNCSLRSLQLDTGR